MAFKRSKSQNHVKCPRSELQANKRRKVEGDRNRPRLNAGNGIDKQKRVKSVSSFSNRSMRHLERKDKQPLREERKHGSESGSEIDSDEAFGESDEERFEGFVFRGSLSSSHVLANSDNGIEDMDGDENGYDGLEDDSDASVNRVIDRSTYHDIEKADVDTTRESYEDGYRGFGQSTEPSDLDGEPISELRGESKKLIDNMSDMDISDEEAESEQKVKQLHNLIKSLPEDDDGKSKPLRSISAIEMLAPSDHLLPVKKKITLQDLLPMLSNSSLKKSLKLIAPSSEPKGQLAEKLDAPLPKRQQDQLDRVAAKRKAKETLDRWIDTVKLNRRADHLSFPLESQDKDRSQNIPSFQHNPVHLPATNLEAAIESILQESGLKNISKGPEKDLQLLEALEVERLPIEEAHARKARLRKTRDLLFREEIRAKRIKKIKSKAYRRVHRKERERNLGKSFSMSDFAGHEISIEEKRNLDRLRAEQRMNTKHRGSKWARDAWQSGRSSWDKETQIAMSELGDRQNQLRRRIEGKSSQDAHNDWMREFSRSSSEESSGSESRNDTTINEFEEDAEAAELKARNKLLGALHHAERSMDGSQVLNPLVKITQHANKSIRDENDLQIKRLHQEFVTAEKSPDDAQEDEGTGPVGRRSFGAQKNNNPPISTGKKKLEFEEDEENSDAPVESSYSEIQDFDLGAGQKTPPNPKSFDKTNNVKGASKFSPDLFQRQAEPNNPWLTEMPGQSDHMSSRPRKTTISENSNSSKTEFKPKASSKAKKAVASKEDKKQITTEPQKANNQLLASERDDNDAVDGELTAQNDELIKEAFAGDDVFVDFKKEKRVVANEETDKIVDNSLPGWGSWVGEGISKKALKRHQGKHTVIDNGVEAEKRKDAKLSRVIINEKKVKKNAKYMATSLPHPFETKGQYEKSLRLPVGRSWTTSETYLNAVKPRVLMKPNTIIRPLRAPMV